jgi:hypothetical protein
MKFSIAFFIGTRRFGQIVGLIFAAIITTGLIAVFFI